MVNVKRRALPPLFLVATLFSSGRFDVKSFGAVGDGTTLDSVAVQEAIDACAEAGGGEVFFPKGRYLAMSLQLKSGVKLVIPRESTLVGSERLSDYTDKVLLRARDAVDIGIEGGGTIDGRGDRFWIREKDYAGDPLRGTAQFEYKAQARPAFLHFIRCDRVTLRDLLLTNSPSWTVHLQRCSNIVAERVTIRNFLYGPNTDGFDLNRCSGVRLRDCDIITGDDGIVLKSTEPGHDAPSTDILAERCRIWSACNGFKIGTETHGDFSGITFRDSLVYSSGRILDRTLAAIAIESVDGARLDGIDVSNIAISNVKTPLFIRLGHRGGNSEKTRQVEPRVPGSITNVRIRNVRAVGSLFESSISGIPGFPVTGVTLEDVRLGYEGGGEADWARADIPDETLIRHYPEAQMFGRLPAWGLWIRHGAGIRILDLALSTGKPDGRPALTVDDARDLRLDGFRPDRSSGGMPVIWLKDVRDGEIRRAVAPRDTGRFIAVEGPAESLTSVVLKDSDTSAARSAVTRGKPGALQSEGLPLFREIRDGLVFLDAAALRLAAPMAIVEDPSIQGGRCIEAPIRSGRDAGFAACRFELKSAGRYVVRVYAYSPTGESDTFYFSIDRGKSHLSDLLRQKAWYWDLVRDRVDDKVVPESHATFALEAGEHVLRIGNRESGTRIARIAVMREEMDFDPGRFFGRAKD